MKKFKKLYKDFILCLFVSIIFIRVYFLYYLKTRLFSMNWGVKQRLGFIEFRLFWEGTINRKDLIDTFDVSVPQASSDIKAYKKEAPGNLYYDKRLKQYLITTKFNPVFGSVNAHDYLSKLSNLDRDIQKHDKKVLGFIPDFSVVPSIDRAIDPNSVKKTC